jgi:hypothetical protein
MHLESKIADRESSSFNLAVIHTTAAMHVR